MSAFYVKSGNCITMQNRAWSLTERMVPDPGDSSSNAVVAKGYVWEVTTTGTSTGTPAWPASVTPGTTTVTQNGVVWTSRDPTSWANAIWSVAYLGASLGSRLAAGDIVYVSSAHAETWSVTQNITPRFPFAAAGNEVKVLSSDDTSGAPPATSLAGAQIIQNLGTGLGWGSINQGQFYGWGITWKSGKAGSNTGFDDWEMQPNPSVGEASALATLENCAVQMLDTGAGDTSHVMVGTAQNAGGKFLWQNVTVKLSLATQYFQLGGGLEWRGGGMDAASGATTTLIQLIGSVPRQSVWEGLDLSTGAASMTLCDVSNAYGQRMVFQNCKLPASWSGNVVSATPNVGTRVEVYNCTAGTIPYQVWIEDNCGVIRQQTTTLIMTGGASDGVATISWKVVTNANPIYPNNVLQMPDIVVWNSTTGGARTATVEFLHDSVTALNNDEVWMECEYLGSASVAQSSIGSNRKANPLGSAAAVTSSTQAWNTSGMSNPNKQKLQIAFTPQNAGFVIARVFVAKTSKTLYINPTLSIA